MIRIPRTIATLVLVVAVVLGALAVGYAFRARLAETAIVGTVLDRIGRAETDPPDAPYWTCPMHPDVHERGPGVCPICGMTLTEVETSAADDPMAAMTNSGQTHLWVFFRGDTAGGGQHRSAASATRRCANSGR